ncbi:beta-1,3-galactosyltransferase 1-like [Argopecten irradians]|uniref:beta-1,3-galactosyltransferase 1-like n=1 Tax=Argopecten irradians TaxID=31199 RepID=UPI0037125066
MQRSTYRNGTLMWKRSLRICSLILIVAVYIMLYLHSHGFANTTSRINNANILTIQDRVSAGKQALFTGGRSSSVNKDDNDENDEVNDSQRQNDQEGRRNGLKSMNDTETFRENDDELQEQNDSVQPNGDRDFQMVLQRKDAVQQDDEVVQIRHLNEVTEEKVFTPSKYPFKVNLSDIIHQYETKGYANEKPINVFDHRYIIQPTETCSGRDSIKVLFIVKSSPDHSVKRAVIRETWADRKRFPWLRIAFSFGIPKNGKSLLHLQEESSKTNDILLVNYSDDYYNLTLKTMSGLRWAASNCARAAYVISIDDDIYVAPDLLLSFLDKLPMRRAEKLYHGYLIRGSSPVRDGNGMFRKWYVSTNEYAFKTYPNYIFGGFVVMSMPTVRTFLIAAMYTKLLKFEDVYLGILAVRVGIEATESGHVDAKKTVTASESFKTVIASHFYQDPYDLKRAWECHLSLISDKTSKSILCHTIGTRLNQLKSEIDSMVNWMESLKKTY